MQNFIIVRTFNSYITANLILTKLLDEFIVCHLKDEHTMLADPLLGNAIGGIKLMVHHTQVDRALEIIAGFETA
jgi:Putative prokaryotic signal transducing protein